VFITSQMLKEKRACELQVVLFERLFPEGTEVTEALCREHYSQLSALWAAHNLLNAAQFAFFKYSMEPHEAECRNKELAAAARACEEAKAAARKFNYFRTEEGARAILTARKAAYKQCDIDIEDARDALQLARALVFYQATLITTG
jgi:hypothetical protein